MKRLAIVLSLLLLCVAGSTQTINPNQIRPSTNNGDVLTTQSGKSGWANPFRGGVWLRNGTIIIGDSTNQYATQEPSVLYENNEFKMWYTCGWSATGLCYATSIDGMNWLKYNSGTPVIAGVFHGFVFKNGATYYYYGVANGAMTAGWRRYSSTDGLTWTLNASNILPSTGSGWDATQRGNIDIWIEGSTWYALYEALGADTIWRIGLATSTDGLTFSPYSGNPVIQNGAGGCGGPDVHKIGSIYYAWVHCTTTAVVEPTDMFRYSSTDLHTWTQNPVGKTLHRTTYDEGSTAVGGQIADPSLVELNSKTYMFYDATDTQGPTPYDGIHLKLVIAPMTMADLVQTSEGDAGATALNSQYNFPLWGYGGPAWSPDGLQIPVHPPDAGRFDLWRLTFLGSIGSAIGYNAYYQSSQWKYTSPGYAGQHYFDSGDGSFHYQSTHATGVAGDSATLVDDLIISRDGKINIPGGITAGAGFQHMRAAIGCSTAASIGASCTSSTQTWAVPMGNSNYDMSCSLYSVSGQPHLVGWNYIGTTGTGFTVTIAADTAAAASANYSCTAVHD